MDHIGCGDLDVQDENAMRSARTMAIRLEVAVSKSNARSRICGRFSSPGERVYNMIHIAGYSDDKRDCEINDVEHKKTDKVLVTAKLIHRCRT